MLWVAIVEIELSKYPSPKVIAVMNAQTFCDSSEIDYLIMNLKLSIATAQWIVNSYSLLNWIEVFYREAKGLLGLKEYQVRDKRSLIRDFILVFCALYGRVSILAPRNCGTA